MMSIRKLQEQLMHIEFDNECLRAIYITLKKSLKSFYQSTVLQLYRL